MRQHRIELEEMRQAKETLSVINSLCFGYTLDETNDYFSQKNGVLHYMPTRNEGEYLVISELPVKKHHPKKFDLWKAQYDNSAHIGRYPAKSRTSLKHSIKLPEHIHLIKEFYS